MIDRVAENEAAASDAVEGILFRPLDLLNG